MTFEIAYVLGLLALVIVVFASERVPVDMVVFLLLAALVLGRVLTVNEAFSGFGQDVIIMLGSVYVISGALKETGMLDSVGATLLRTFGRNANLLLPVIMTVVALFSAFMNNTTVTAMFVGPVIGLCKQAKLSASRYLMPVAFASILGGTCTLVGTSTNLAVSGYLDKHAHETALDKSLPPEVVEKRQAELHPLGMFEFSLLGIGITVLGIAYMSVFGRRLLPEHPVEDVTEEFSIRNYLAEIVILNDSPIIGQTIGDSDLGILGFNVLKIVREGSELAPVPDRRFFADDVVMVAGNLETLMKVKRIEGLEIKADMKFREQDLQSSKGRNIRAGEMLVTERSSIVGRTIKEAEFRRVFGLTVLAMFRGGKSIHSAMENVVIRPGDLLLVQGPAERFVGLEDRQDELVLLGGFDDIGPKRGVGWLVLGAFFLAVTMGSMEKITGIPVVMAVLVVAVLSVLTGAIKAERCYRAVDWRSLILIGGMTAFGGAMLKSGTSDWLATQVLRLLEPMGDHAVLAGFCLLTVLLTQPMSNAAAAMVVLPVALTAAELLGLNLRCFAVAIMLSASMSLMTPFEPSCLLVIGPGKYRISDFVRVGGLLTLGMLILVVLVVPMIWPLRH